MPSLNVTALNDSPQDTLPQSSGSVFTDMSLDFSLDDVGGNKALFGSTVKRDMKVSTDYKAISNSLMNIFNTTPGEKILNPTFGVNLSRYLFEPVSEEIAGVIGDVILQGIEKYEPRVDVTKVDIIADPDDNSYEINIFLSIVALKGSFTFTGNLDSKGLSTTSY